MCSDGTTEEHAPGADASLDPVLSGRYRPSRRGVLQAGGVAAIAAAAKSLWVPGSAWGASPRTLTGLNPVRNAMHVHAAWSEGPGSWESQFAQASAIGTDVLWMTDHDFRALAYKYITSLNGVAMVSGHTGTLAQNTTTNNSGVTRVLAESAGTAAASVSYATPVHPTAFTLMRGSIAGQKLIVTFPATRIDAGGMYEIVVQLSNHPAYGTRPVGQFELHYRYGNFTAARFVDPSGLIGIVRKPTPVAGSQQTLDLTADVAALWPDMQAIDNSLFLLTLVATSPAKGKVVDVSASVQYTRSQNNSSSLITNQQTVLNTYAPRYPNMKGYPTVEISYLDPHIIPYGVPQFWPDQAPIEKNKATTYNSIADSVHSQGGLMSYTHPFGATQGALLPADQQASLRRSTFSTMLANNRYRTDLLEVGYTTRGSCNTQTHIDLWDTFSRRAIFITGNGVNDDHGGLNWSTLTNGFATGFWATSPSQADLIAAMKAGRAYTYHAGKWPNGQLDLNVGGRIPMGKVGVNATLTSRSLTIFAANLPASSVVDIVQGPVDFTGTDPGTSVIKSFAASAFGSSATVGTTINTTNACFVRAQVRNSAGAIIGISNPVWVLKSQPPGGIPAARVP
jgi:hypothetical protein